MTQASGCGANTALIGVGDGYIQNLCGCTEADGTTSVTQDGFTCTVSNGDTVIFHYLGTKLKHQILSTSGGKSFPATPVNDPNSDHPVWSFSISITETGTFFFQDAFNPIISGQIISI